MDITSIPTTKITGYRDIAISPIKKIDTQLDLPNKDKQNNTNKDPGTTYTKDLKTKSKHKKENGSIIDIYV